jgi:hypothetical protein
MSRVSDVLNGNRRISTAQKAVFDGLSPADTYRVLEFYYLSNGLYALLQDNNSDHTIWVDGMLGLRNPSHRVVEFYVGKLWPGDLPAALPIVPTKKDAIIKPVQQVWEWSNWASEKQVFSRWFSNFGDGFIKVASNDRRDRVYLENLKPEYVTDIDEARGSLTFCRIDIPQTRRLPDGKIESYWHTEVWNKADLSLRIWENKKGPSEPLDRLGTPKTDLNYQSEYQIDFIPIVHAKFQDIGQRRGVGAFTHALDKIDECNRQATRLHQILFRYQEAIWAIRADDKDPTGRPLPAPKINVDGTSTVGETNMAGGTKVVYLPGMSKLDLMIPDIKYDQALAILNAQIADLMHDLPELAYYAIRERTGEITGRAARILLGDLIDKATEARGNAEAALARADAMALTIAQNMNLFEGLGSYENGDFDHKFGKREIIPASDFEQAETMRAYTQAGAPVETAAAWSGRSPEDITALNAARQQEQVRNTQSLAMALTEQRRRFDSGEGEGTDTNQDSNRSKTGA